MYLMMRTIGYFVTWGIIYGFIIGAITGASAWVMGAVLGALLGPIAGAGIGLILGLITALIHRMTFHQDIDLTRYRRCTAVFNGFLTFFVVLTGLLILAIYALKYRPWGLTAADFYPLVISFTAQAALLSALCMAYISSHYANWIVGVIYIPRPQYAPYPVKMMMGTMEWYLPGTTCGCPGRIAYGLAFSFYISEFAPVYQLPLLGSNLLGHLVVGVFAGWLLIAIVTPYIAIINALWLTFLRRLIVDEGFVSRSTYHYKLGMMIVSFVVTTWMTSWYWVLAPFPNFRFEPVSPLQGMRLIIAPLLGLVAAYTVHCIVDGEQPMHARKEKENSSEALRQS